MTVATKPGALRAARAQGFIEAEFMRTPRKSRAFTAEGRLGDQVTTWGEECDEANRHGIIVGRYADGSFLLMLVLRCGEPELEYRLEEMRDVFRDHFGREPVVDVQEADAEVWTSPKACRKRVVAAACELVALDRRERDERIEIASRVMTS